MTELKKKVESALKKQGYSLELQVARAFLQAGFHTSVSDYFTDYESSKPREIDVVASKFSDRSMPVILRTTFVVECKRSPKPWVIFASESPPSYFIPFNTLTSKIAEAFLAEKYEDYQSHGFFNPQLVGHGIKAITLAESANSADPREHQDQAYSAVMQATKAAVAKVLQVDSEPTVDKKRYLAEIALPVVVIDGKLFKCTLGADQEIRTEEIMAGALLWKYDNPAKIFPLVHVITSDAVPGFVRTSNELCELILQGAQNRMASLQGHISKYSKITIGGY